MATPSPALRRRFRRVRRSLVGLAGGLGAVALALVPLRGSAPASSAALVPAELLRNGGFESAMEDWGPAGSGFELAPGEGRAGSRALACEARGPGRFAGAFQTLRLERSRMLLIRISGWSRSRDVDGAPDDDYSLHASVEFQDGSRLDKVAVPFDCGTHGWQRRELLLPAMGPVKTLVLHCLFRRHSGRAWFDDVSVEEYRPAPGTMLLEGYPLDLAVPRARSVGPPRRLDAGNGLSVEVRGDRIVSVIAGDEETRPSGPSGFLVRDAACGDSWRPAGDDPRLALEARWRPGRDHLAVEGELRARGGADRAVSLAFALPWNAIDGRFEDGLRRSRAIDPKGEFVNAVPIPCGSTATISRYPVAAAFSRRAGMALAVDPDLAAQCRIGYHAEARLLFVSYDFGLPADGAARFRFVLYRCDPEEGFRGALSRLYSLFPAAFARRCLDLGTWLPFTPPERIPNREDFGFAFRELPPGGTSDADGLRAFRYAEPLGHWMALPADQPRTAESLLSRLPDPLRRAAMKSAAGLPQLQFRREPWCDGAVISVNPNPRLPGAGEFIDSAEGYAMAELDFDGDHVRRSSSPPTFSIDARAAVLFKGQILHEYAGGAARDLHAQGRLMFGNGTPRRFFFLAPSLDILGNEVDWFPGGVFAPPDDADLCFWRAMAFQKPCCVLLNTEFDRLSPGTLDLYFERCLFYGLFPGFFSHDGQNDAYWDNPQRVERDRPRFRKYLPLIRRTAAAGWQPVTEARCDNAAILLERYGPDAKGVLYLALLNSSREVQEGTIVVDRLRRRPTPPATVRELVTGAAVPVRDRTLRLAIPAGAARLIELRDP